MSLRDAKASEGRKLRENHRRVQSTLADNKLTASTRSRSRRNVINDNRAKLAIQKRKCKYFLTSPLTTRLRAERID